MPIFKAFCTILIFLLAVTTGGIPGGAMVPPPGQDPPQQPPRPPISDEERRRVMERLMEQMRKAQEAQQQVPAPQTQQPATQPAGPPAGPLPSLVQRAPLAADQIQLSYDNADLYDFINQLADTLGLTPIIIDPEIKGSVTIHSNAPMAKAEVFPLFNIILKNNNAALVSDGRFYQIVPISSGLKKGLELVEHYPPQPPAKPDAEAQPGGTTPQTPPAAQTTPPAQTPPPQPPPTPPPAAQAPPSRPADDVPRLATHVIRVEFVPVRDLVEPIKIFMTDGGVIIPYDRLNMLILTDYSDSVRKIIEVIRLLDDSYLNPDLVELIKIKFNNSADVLEDLRKIFGSGTKDSGTGVYFVSLDRMNSILVMANSKRALEEVKRWIEKLDATTGRTLQTFVYTVENGTASNIVSILAALYGGEGSTTGEQRGTTQGSGPFGTGVGATQTGTREGVGAAGRTGALGSGTSTLGAGGAGFTSTGGGGGGGGLGSFGGGGLVGGSQLGPRLSTGTGTSSQVLRGGAISGLQEQVRIVVDEINNALIIQASAADYAYILETIKKLDVLPRQALIDARIFEIELTDTLSYGISSALQARSANGNLTTGSIDATAGALKASTFAFIGNSREILLTLDALREKTKVKVLESPTLLALDGTEAKITVGGEVPYPGGTFVGAAGSSTTSVQYRETGISLIIIPRISASGNVTLALAQEVSSPGAPTSVGPTFNKTSISTTLAVKDGETVTIAGLIRDSDNSGRSGVPYLANIPIFGFLFGKVKRTITRTELLILITPHVIRTPERFKEMTEEVKDSLRGVRPFVEEKEQERLKVLEEAQKARAKQQQKKAAKPEEPPPAEPTPTPPAKPPV